MRRLLIFIAVLFSKQVIAQNVEVVNSETRATSYQGRSYLVVKSLKLKAPENGQFKISAATDGPFFMRMAQASKIASNVAPSPDQNFVREESILIDGVTQENQIPDLPVESRAILYKYIDGMGREMESVNVKASPLQNDVIQAGYFDNAGHNTKEYLPYTSTQGNGAYRSSYDSESKSFYSSSPQVAYEANRPFKENIYENSSLDRITDTYGAGSAWYDLSRRKQDHTRIDAGGSVRRWIYIDDDTPPTLGTYDTLLVVESMDEENHVVQEYTDKRGLVVLSRKQGSGDYVNSPGSVVWLETYHVYDDFGLLKMVVPPEASSRISTEYVTDNTIRNNFIRRWCFQYRHDANRNVIAKWVPGWSDWHYTVYDRWNREVLTQTPAQRERNEWTFTKYDRFNRSILTGLWVTSASVQTIRTDAAASSQRFESVPANPGGTPEGYSYNVTYPTSVTPSELISITYYDDYSFLNYTDWDIEGTNSDYNPVSVTGFPQPASFLTNVTGHITGSKVKVLGENKWLNSVTRYDGKYRSVQVISENNIGGKDRITTEYSFNGKALQTHMYHTSTATSLTILRKFVYDHAQRLSQVYQTTDGGQPVLIASHKYNEVGDLIEKNIHSVDGGASFLQSIDYRYNIRGWLTSINNSALNNDGNLNNDATDIFGMELLYHPSSQFGVGTVGAQYTVPKLFDGNIAAIKWKTDTRQEAPKEKIYAFEYDALSRFKKSHYATNNGGDWTGNAGWFNEAIKTYDNNGNIQGIERYGEVDGVKTRIDSTYYNYNYTGTTIGNFKGVGNRLWKIKDAGNAYGFKDAPVQINEEFRYDPSGNLTYDNNKGISKITYNHLNLPEWIEMTRTDNSVERIRYTYNATGNKLSTTVWKGGTINNNGAQVWQTDYTGEVQYDKAGANASQLTFASTPEGRVLKNGTSYDYEYFYKDHQGNIRATYGLLRETVSYRATMEDPASSPALGDKEESQFSNIAQTRYQDVPASVTYNYTKPSDQVLNPDRSAQTNGTNPSKVIGPAIRLHVSNGDKIRMEVFAKYTQVPGANAQPIADAVLIAAATGSFGISSTGETAGLYSGFTSQVPFIPGAGSVSTTLPQAYLAYLFFTDSYSFVTSGAVAISTNAYNAFEKLERTFSPDQSGYLYIYVANETNVASVNVHFDEMLIVHQKNDNTLQVTQASDYYPFGLSFNSYQSERIKDDYSSVQKNRYGFQGQEFQKDLDLGWSQFKWRMHDPAIGRFGAVDPLAEKYLYNSTYAFSENKVTGHVELEGLEAINYRFFEAYLWKDAGYSYRPSENETRQQGTDLLKVWIGTQLTIMSMAIPVEEVAIIAIASKFPAVARFVGLSSSLTKNIRLAKGGSYEYHGMEFLDEGLRMTEQAFEAKKTATAPVKSLEDVKVGNGKLDDFRSNESGAQDMEYVNDLKEQILTASKWLEAPVWPHRPLLVVKVDGKYVVINGNHRYEAAKAADFKGDIPFKEIPVEESGYTIEQLRATFKK